MINFVNIPVELLVALAFATSFVVTYFSIPPIIRLSLVKKLYDLPDQRKLHNARISPLGGVAIFGGLMLSFIFYTAHITNPTLNSVLVALIILFITGVKDDLYPLTPYKKFLGQFLAVAIIVFQGDIRLESFYGILEIWQLPYAVSVSITIFFFLAIINSFNFIDGINGLSAGIGTAVSLTYAAWFYYLGQDLFLILALCIAGSQLAFLRYNLVNAKIFMGDSGSMVLGFFSALLTIGFLQANEKSNQMYLLHIDALVFALAVLIVPIADTLRVVIIRIFILKKSPFAADRNHIHHTLLDLGFSHLKATATLVGATIGFILFVHILNDYLRASYLLLAMFVLAFVLSQIPFVLKNRKMN